MTEGRIEYESHEGVGVIRICRPEKRNAMTAAMCESLGHALVRLQASDDRVGVIVAQGEVFCAGADLNSPPSEFWKGLPEIGVLVDKPLIAAVQGPVVGLGLALVAFCDLCVASDDARLLYPEARVGISKGLISTLVARVPHKMAMELMLCGGPISAARAFDVGFVNRVVPVGQQEEAALEMARGMTASAPLVLAQLKQLARETLPASPVERMYRTSGLIAQVLDSADAEEGLKAFSEKRAPHFEGR